MKWIAATLLLFKSFLWGGDSVRPGLEGLDGQMSIADKDEATLVQAIKQPLLKGLDVQKALQKWFDGRLAASRGKHADARSAWQEGVRCLTGLAPLPKRQWGPIPDATLQTIAVFSLEETPGVEVRVVTWTVSGLTQYGILLVPAGASEAHPMPVLLYTHGAAFGIPVHFLPWLGALAARGYIIAGPAMRGEPLFAPETPVKGRNLVCGGEIENLEGEVDDCLSMLSAVWKLPCAKKDAFAMVGHSFGAGVGLLAAARAGDKCKAVVSYDAWLVNPQRYYWDRMDRGANNWLSWADFCNRPVPDQLQGLMTRSLVHNAEKLKAQALFFIGGAYAGSVFHLSHDDLFAEFKKINKAYTYMVMPNAGHNFVLYTQSKPAQDALKMQTRFLDRHFPPAP